MAKRIGIVGTRFTELHSPEWKSQLQSIIDSLPNDVEKENIALDDFGG